MSYPFNSLSTISLTKYIFPDSSALKKTRLLNEYLHIESRKTLYFLLIDAGHLPLSAGHRRYNNRYGNKAEESSFRKCPHFVCSIKRQMDKQNLHLLNLNEEAARVIVNLFHYQPFLKNKPLWILHEELMLLSVAEIATCVCITGFQVHVPLNFCSSVI